MAQIDRTNDKTEISFMDVKALYDAAQNEKMQATINMKKYYALMKQADHMAHLYRQQLNKMAQRPFSYKRAA